MGDEMSDQFILTSVLEFADRLEGQVFHIGTIEECEKMADSVDALFYSGGDEVLSSGFKWFPKSAYELSLGECWIVPKVTR
jgi:hypothetical protein